MKRLIIYKEKNFDSWLEFIMTLGVCRLRDGGFMIFIYFWGGGIAMLVMFLMLKYVV
jgi:hypothetical protein